MIFCHYLAKKKKKKKKKKSAFLVIPENGFSDFFPFQTVYFYSHQSNSLKVTALQISKIFWFDPGGIDTPIREINSQCIIQMMEEEKKRKKKKKREEGSKRIS